MLSKLSVITCSNFFTTGPANALEQFLSSRTSFLACAFHPFYYSKLRHSFVNIYEDGFPLRTRYFRTLPRFGVLSYLRDYALSFMLPIFLRKKFDYFIGSNPLNALAGITLRKLGFVRKVIFYKIDYVPTRFTNPVLNFFYDQLDRISSELSDWTWNLAQPMISERVKRGFRLGPQLIVPIGSNFERIQRRPPSQVYRNRIVYMGSLRQGQGIQMAVEAFDKVRSILPHAEFVIVGTGPLAKELKKHVNKLGLDDFVTFKGEVPNHEEVEKILTTCGIGLATYEPSPNNFTRYTEPGKVKVYLACGLPVIITRVPEIANEIEARGAGIVSDYTIDGLASTIVKLIQDETTYMDARSAAIAFASQFTWDNVFDRAFNSMLEIGIQ